MTLPSSSQPESGSPPRLFTYRDVEGAIIDGQWLVRDVALGARLGLRRPDDIRRVIVSNMEELETFGLVRFQNAPIRSGKGRVTWVKEYYLNQSQVLLIAMQGRTAASRALRAHMIHVYNQWHADGMGRRIADPSFWPAERLRHAVGRYTAIEEARGDLVTRRVEEERWRARLAELEGRSLALATRIAEHERALHALEPDPATLSSFGRELMELSFPACLFHVVASGYGGDLVAPLGRIFRLRAVRRDVDASLAAFRQLAIVNSDPHATIEPFAMRLAPSCRRYVEERAASGDGPAAIAAALSAMRLAADRQNEPDPLVEAAWDLGGVATPVLVLEVLIAAGAEDRLDDRAVAVWDLAAAVALRRQTMPGSRPDEFLSFPPQREPILLPPAQGAPADLMGETAGSVATIGQSIERALAGKLDGLSRAELPDAASAAAGRALNPISVVGQLPRLRDAGRIVCVDGRWRLPVVM